MEKLRLMTGKEYQLPVGGFFADEEVGKARIRIVTDETVETIMETFSLADATQEMKVIESDGSVQQTASGFTERGNVFVRAVNVAVDSVMTNEGLKEIIGNTVEFYMSRKSLERTVEENRADIDYLMMMEGEGI